MKVHELIEELGKYQPHYTVMLVTPSCGTYMSCAEADPGSECEWSFVSEVEIETNMGSVGPVVKIMAGSDK